MKLPIIAFAAVAASGSVQAASLVYDQNFQGAVGSEWSITATSVTPVGARRFLGEFGNAVVTLGLNSLPVHSYATISFDLYVIRSMDGNGNGAYPGIGPDLWSLLLGNTSSQAVAMNTTFDNFGLSYQSYPDNYNGILAHIGQTGADEVNTLGYSFADRPMDSVYNLTVTVPHTDDTFVAKFQGSGMQGLGDEAWGIDNVTVSISGSVSEVPESPATAAGAGVLGVALWCWRSRKITAGAAVQAN